MTLKLSVLDQSLTRSASEASQAFKETIGMAQLAEKLGYERFWVSEHHAFPAIAGSAPEVLLAAIGAATASIRIGSGGIMLPHYSAYKVAEQFSVLANLYPDRIDLGVGRAPGADMSTARALAPDRKPDFHKFPTQVEQLSEYLWQDHTSPFLSPPAPKDLPLWMLGSSADSAHLAAERGLPYNLGAFINPDVDTGLIKRYKTLFKPSKLQTKPYAILAVAAFCAETESEAKALRQTHDVNTFRFITGQSKGEFLAPNEALSFPDSPQFQWFVQQREATRAVGTPSQVKARLEALAEQFDADEIMIVTNMYYFEDRQRSFELLKQAFAS